MPENTYIDDEQLLAMTGGAAEKDIQAQIAAGGDPARTRKAMLAILRRSYDKNNKPATVSVRGTAESVRGAVGPAPDTRSGYERISGAPAPKNAQVDPEVQKRKDAEFGLEMMGRQMDMARQNQSVMEKTMDWGIYHRLIKSGMDVNLAGMQAMKTVQTPREFYDLKQTHGEIAARNILASRQIEAQRAAMSPDEQQAELNRRKDAMRAAQFGGQPASQIVTGQDSLEPLMGDRAAIIPTQPDQQFVTDMFAKEQAEIDSLFGGPVVSEPGTPEEAYAGLGDPNAPVGGRPAIPGVGGGTKIGTLQTQQHHLEAYEGIGQNIDLQPSLVGNRRELKQLMSADPERYNNYEFISNFETPGSRDLPNGNPGPVVQRIISSTDWKELANSFNIVEFGGLKAFPAQKKSAKNAIHKAIVSQLQKGMMPAAIRRAWSASTALQGSFDAEGEYVPGALGSDWSEDEIIELEKFMDSVLESQSKSIYLK